MSDARVFVLIVLAACRPVVAAAEPGTEPADPKGAATSWTAPVDPTRASAFAGEKLADEHAHHHHGGHGGGAKPDAKAEPAKPDAKAEPAKDGAAKHDHAGHLP